MILKKSLPFPPIAEQKRIVMEIDRRLSFIYEVESQVDINLKRVNRLRQSILSKAFSGELLINTTAINNQSDSLTLVSV